MLVMTLVHLWLPRPDPSVNIGFLNMLNQRLRIISPLTDDQYTSNSLDLYDIIQHRNSVLDHTLVGMNLTSVKSFSIKIQC